MPGIIDLWSRGVAALPFPDFTGNGSQRMVSGLRGGESVHLESAGIPLSLLALYNSLASYFNAKEAG